MMGMYRVEMADRQIGKQREKNTQGLSIMDMSREQVAGRQTRQTDEHNLCHGGHH